MTSTSAVFHLCKSYSVWTDKYLLPGTVSAQFYRVTAGSIVSPPLPMVPP